MPPVRARARAGGSDLMEGLRRLLPGKRLPPDLTSLYGFTGDEDMIAGPPRAILSASDCAKVRRALKGRADDESRLLRSLAAVLSGKPADAVSMLRDMTDGAAYLVRSTALWLHADRTRSRHPLIEAFECVEHAERLLGKRRDVLLLKAQLLLEVELNAEGVAALQAVLALAPGDWRTRLGLADTFADMKRYEPALEQLALVQKKTGPTWWLLGQRARFKGLCGRPEEALKDFAAALKKGRRGGLYAWRAETLRRLGRLKEAERDLAVAARLDPRYALTFETRGRLRLMQGRDKAALADLTRACRLDAARKLSFAFRAEAYWKTGRAREAYADFAAVAPLDPGTLWNPPTGRVESRLIREAAFLTSLDDAVRRRPQDAWARLTRGFLTLTKGRPAAALEDLTVAAASPACRDTALLHRAEALTRLGARERAAADLAARRKP